MSAEDFEGEFDLGQCCICEIRGRTVRNFVSLDRLAPETGKGWGCVVCNLPSDGAYSVLCDKCVREYQNKKVELKFVVSGFPNENKRVLYSKLAVGEFKHNVEAHAAEDMISFM